MYMRCDYLKTVSIKLGDQGFKLHVYIITISTSRTLIKKQSKLFRLQLGFAFILHTFKYDTKINIYSFVTIWGQGLLIFSKKAK